MSKLWVIISIAIFTVSFVGCQEEAKVATMQETPTEQVAVAEQPKTAVEENVGAQKAVEETTKEAVVEQAAPAAAEKPKAVEETAKKAVVEQTTPVAVEEPAAKQQAPVEQVDSSAVAVTVNGKEITENEINTELQKRIEMMKKRMPPGAEMQDLQIQQMRGRVVDMSIEQALLDQELKKHNITISDDQVVEEIKKIAGKGGKTMEEVEAEIAKMGMTLNDIKGQIRMQMQEKALIETLNPDAAVSEDDVKKFYDDNPQYFNKPEQIRASHILCGKRGIKEDEYPAELEKIKKAKARLDAGESFEDVAKDVSTCPSASKGGDLGFFGKGQMDPAFEKAAFALEPGQVSDIVKSSFGYHIIKVTEKKEASVTPFEEAKDQIENFLTQQKQRKLWDTYSKTMRENATIEYSAEEQAKQKAAEEARAAHMPKMPPPKAAPSAPAPKPEATEQK